MTATIRSPAERTFRGRHLIFAARINGNGSLQRTRTALKAGFGYTMVVGAVQHLRMQRNSGVHREGLEQLLHKLGVNGADLVAHELGFEEQVRSTGYVDRHPR